MKIKSKLDFVSPIVVLLCISLCSHFLLHRSICCLVLGMLLSFPNPWTFRSYFMACCWSSAMFKSSLNAIPRIQCLPCQHNSALCKQNLYSAFFYSLQWLSRLIQKYVISPLSSSTSLPKSCEFYLPFIEAFRQLVTIIFVIMVEKICFRVLFGISLYQSPRVQVELQSPLHFDSIISFSTKKSSVSSN